MYRFGGPAKAGKVLVGNAGNRPQPAASCVKKYADVGYPEAEILLHTLPQVVAVSDVPGFCAELRELGGTAWPRKEWPGTAEEWAAAERRFPPFRIGRYQVSYRWSATVTLFSYRGGGVSFDLNKCEAFVSFGTDRMSAGCFSTSFDKNGTVTAGQVCAWAASYIRNEMGSEIPPAYLNDGTVLWPVVPYAGTQTPEPVKPARPAPGDEAAQREKAAALEAEARTRTVKALRPFLERHADPGGRDACAAQILEYFGFRGGNYHKLDRELHCHVTPDEVRFTKNWGSHSFFDDGGGIEGRESRWIAWAPPGQDIEAFRDDGEPHRYTLGGAPEEHCEYREDPFGLKGRYGLFYRRVEEHTD